MLHKRFPIFFVDAMLGNIARKLRLLGYDTKYFSDINDEKLIKNAKDEDRIIISRDEDLIKKSHKLGIKSIYLTKIDEIDQFCEIIRNVNLDVSQINGDTARCPICNSITENIDKSYTKDKVPEKVYDSNEQFWICKSCDKLYWEGTHIKNLQKFVSKINERLQ